MAFVASNRANATCAGTREVWAVREVAVGPSFSLKACSVTSIQVVTVSAFAAASPTTSEAATARVERALATDLALERRSFMKTSSWFSFLW